jgi:sarcosine oxidase
VPAVELDADSARELFPIAGDLTSQLLFDPLAGAIRAADAVAALSDCAEASLRRAEVGSIAVHGDSVEVRVDGGVHRAARCVVCAGAGTDRLVRPLGLEIRQERQAHLRLAFRTRVSSSGPLPCFSDRRGSRSDIVYALSDLDDRYAVGLAAVDEYPRIADLASEVPAGVDVSSQRERIISYVSRTLPGLDPRPVDEVMRLTTTTPENPEDGFGIWREAPVVALAGPNLFKFAPVLGERLAGQATDEGTVSTARGTPVAPSR